MVEEIEQVTGLSGEEVINDLLDQIGRKLRLDCNLRGSDAYDYGYSAKVDVHLKLYGLDDVSVDIAVKAISGKVVGDATEIESAIEVEREPDLNVVRDRANLPEPTVEKDDGQPPEARQKRKYTRHVPTPGAAAGGSEGELSE